MPAPSPRVLQRWEVWRVVWKHSDGVTSSTRPALLVDERPDPYSPTFRFVPISERVKKSRAEPPALRALGLGDVTPIEPE